MSAMTGMRSRRAMRALKQARRHLSRIGLGAAVDYLTRVGVEAIHHHEQRLTGKAAGGPARDRWRSGLWLEPRLKQAGARRRGLLAVEGLLPHEVALMLDQASSISVRSGHHCCIP